MRYLLPAAVLAPVVAGVALTFGSSPGARRATAWTAALLVAALWLAAAALDARNAEPLQFAADGTPWSWGSKGPSLELKLQMSLTEALWMPALAGALFGATAVATSSAEGRDELPAIFGIAACTVGMLTAATLPLAAACLLGSSLLAPLALRSIPVASLAACVARPIAADFAVVGMLAGRGAEAEIGGAAGVVLALAAALRMGAFPFGGWIVQASRRAEKEVAAVMPWLLVGSAIFASKWVAPAFAAEFPRAGVALAAAFALAALASISEARPLAKLCYLASGHVAFHLALMKGDASSPSAVVPFVGFVCAVAATAPAMVGGWRGGPWHSVVLFLWMIVPFAACRRAPASQFDVNDPSWSTWLLISAGCMLSAIALSRLSASESDAARTSSAASAVPPLASIFCAAAAAAHYARIGV